jgi:hypothetical protein
MLIVLLANTVDLELVLMSLNSPFIGFSKAAWKATWEQRIAFPKLPVNLLRK